MSSCAGRVPGPGMGPYFMSKHAVEAYSDTIRFCDYLFTLIIVTLFKRIIAIY